MGLWDDAKNVLEKGLEFAFYPEYIVGKEIGEVGEREGGALLAWLQNKPPAEVGCELIAKESCKQLAYNFGHKDNPFKCNFPELNRFRKGFQPLRNPVENPDCSTIAYIALFGLVVGGCVGVIMILVILNQLGFNMGTLLEVSVQLMEYIAYGLEWLLTLWEWAYWMVTYTSQVVAQGTGVNPLLLWFLGLEGLVAGSLILVHNSLRLYWNFHETAAYPLFFWLNTPIRYIVTEWLNPTLGFFLTGVIEMLVFFPLEIPLLAVALSYGALKKLYEWLKGEWASKVYGFNVLHPPKQSL